MRAITNPATTDHLASVPDTDAATVDDAIRGAREAQRGAWGRAAPAERAAALSRLAELMRRDHEHLAHLESSNVGKTLREARSFDIPGAIEAVTYYAGWADKLYGETIPAPRMPVLSYTVREAVGVVAAIVPWNFPLALACWKLAPALAAGNTVVLKPSELTPLTALHLAELAIEAGLPAGALSVVTGGAETGEALCRHPDVAKVAFTGSTAVGRRVMELAAQTLKGVMLECGGKSPSIVFADADLERALDATLFGIFANQGEVCAAGSRLLVDGRIHEEFVGELTRRAGGLVVGDPLAPQSDLGALVSSNHLARVEELVTSGVEEGAEVRTGGRRATIDGLGGSFYEPTILGGVRADMRVAQEEIFGPVLAVLPFDSEAEAVDLANSTMYGLTANLHTSDVRRAHAIAAALDTGTVFINLPPIPLIEVPAGGHRQSGIGIERGRDGMEEYVTTKSVVLDLSGPGEHFRWFGSAPYGDSSPPGEAG